jgi:hypothetical protein
MRLPVNRVLDLDQASFGGVTKSPDEGFTTFRKMASMRAITPVPTTHYIPSGTGPSFPSTWNACAYV